MSLRPESRAQAHDPDLVEPLGKVSAVFLTGGNQLKLSSFITGTPFGDAIQEAISARHGGWRYLGRCQHHGRTHDRVRRRRLHTQAADEPAFCRPRPAARRGDRSTLRTAQPLRTAALPGRPVALTARLGIDEDTAAVIHDGSRLEVIGRGAVTVVDGQNLVSNAFAAKRTAPLLISGAVIHVLPAGSQFDLTSRTLLAHQTAVPDPEVLEARAAEADLRELAREKVAAEGRRSPTSADFAGPSGCAALQLRRSSGRLLSDQELTARLTTLVCRAPAATDGPFPAGSSCCPESRPSRL